MICDYVWRFSGCHWRQICWPRLWFEQSAANRAGNGSILVKNVDISFIMKINAATGIPVEDETLHVAWVSDDASFKYSMPDYANAWRAVKFDSLEQSGDGAVIVGTDGDDVIEEPNQVDDVLRVKAATMCFTVIKAMTSYSAVREMIF